MTVDSSAGSAFSKVRALIHDWPAGFADSLPEEPWLVLHTNVRMEKCLIRDLEKLNIPGLIFYEERLRRYPGKGLQRSLIPLLAGYLFVHCGPEHRIELLQTNRVRTVLDVVDPTRLAADLQSLITLVRQPKGAVTPSLMVRPELVPGRRVRITQGTFQGFQGVVRKRRGQVDLVVNLEMLGTSVRARVPADTAELSGDG